MKTYRGYLLNDMSSFTMKQKLNAMGKPDLFGRVEEVFLILEK